MTEHSPSASASWINTLRAVVAAVEASDVSELELRTPGLRIALRRTVAGAVEAGPMGEIASALDLPVVRSPLTGIWYDAPAPGTPPYVRVGDTVNEGFVIGLVETMKVFNEVTSTLTGIVRQIMVRRGELVMADAPLLTIEPTSGAQLPGGLL